MARQQTTWIVMADGSRARIVRRRAEDRGFEVILQLAAPETHLPSRELGSDRPGRVQESRDVTRHAIQPRQDLHRKNMDAFLRRVATRLNDAGAQKSYDALILFAPPHALGELRRHLSAAAEKKVKAAIAKDLNKLPLEELAEHLPVLKK